MCNLCYQYDNATLVSKAIEFYTDLAIAYSKTSEYYICSDINKSLFSLPEFQNKPIIP